MLSKMCGNASSSSSNYFHETRLRGLNATREEVLQLHEITIELMRRRRLSDNIDGIPINLALVEWDETDWVVRSLSEFICDTVLYEECDTQCSKLSPCDSFCSRFARCSFYTSRALYADFLNQVQKEVASRVDKSALQLFRAIYLPTMSCSDDESIANRRIENCFSTRENGRTGTYARIGNCSAARWTVHAATKRAMEMQTGRSLRCKYSAVDAAFSAAVFALFVFRAAKRLQLRYTTSLELVDTGFRSGPLLHIVAAAVLLVLLLGVGIGAMLLS